MKPKKITVFLIFFLILSTIKTYGQSKIQKDSTKIVEAFNRTQTVDIGSEIVDSLKNIIASLTGKIKNMKSKRLN